MSIPETQTKTRGRPPAERWLAVAAACRENPGVWHYIGRQHTAFRNQIKSGRIAAFRPAGTFDAICRKTENGKADLYVVYIPKEK
jgi:hypothetical protein